LELKDVVERDMGSMPHPNVSVLMDSIQGAAPPHLCSLHWFAR
jgi:hypothetical protein